MKILPFWQSAKIMNSGIENQFVSGKCLQISAVLVIFLQDTDFQTFFRQNESRSKTSQSAADNKYVVFFFQRRKCVFLKIRNSEIKSKQVLFVVLKDLIIA